MAAHCHNTPGLPGETLNEIHDCLVLTLDATDGDQPRRWQVLERRGTGRSADGLAGDGQRRALPVAGNAHHRADRGQL